ncbi:MAG TPA: hypothetical protein DCZ75_06220 [Geobacter sp.]|nr:hypothetical protein [Geobacter sp.]
MNRETLWLSCGVVRDELLQLHRQGLISGSLLFLDSMLHMNPPNLEAELQAELRRQSNEERLIVLVYGDCSPGMLDLVRRFKAGRIDAINCAQFLVGRERYRELMREEAFLVLPEWARRWKHVMGHELGLSRPVARELMGENRGALVYLDTGITPAPREELAEFSEYTGLPWRVEAVTLEPALAELLKAQARAMAARPREESI